MAVKIRLKRLGKIRAPYYRIVVADSRTKRDGRVIEEIGKYHPTEEPSFIEVDSERAQYWLSVGAQPTEQVAAILKLTGDWGKFKGDKNAVSTVQVEGAQGRVRRRREEEAGAQAQGREARGKAEAPAEARRRRGRDGRGVVRARRPRSNTSSRGSSITLTTCRSSPRRVARGEVLEVHVHPEDLGRVIGRAGRTAKALRTLVTALADGRRVRVDVVDTDD